MMSQPPLDWNAVAAFLAVARTGSLSAAGRELGLAQPTVRRQIAGLEAALGEALFARGPNGLFPTERALALLPYASDVAAGVGALARAAGEASGRVAGRVRITASRVIGTEVLPALLAPLREAHPGLVLELSPVDRVEDLMRREADVAVRMVRPSQAGIVARRAGRIGLGLYAAPDYLRRKGMPSAPAEVAGHDFAGDDGRDTLLRGLAELGLALPPERVVFRSDDDLAQLAAVRAGIGIGICQHGLAARLGLQRVLPAVETGLETWVAMHEDMRHSPRIRAVFEHLSTALAAYARSGEEGDWETVPHVARADAVSR